MADELLDGDGGLSYDHDHRLIEDVASVLVPNNVRLPVLVLFTATGGGLAPSGRSPADDRSPRSARSRYSLSSARVGLLGRVNDLG